MISKNSIIILSVLLGVCLTQLCSTPQKSFYMSYNAISNHDYLSDMFENVSQSLPQYNITYTDKNGSVYSVLNFRPHLYYSEYRQVQSYVDPLTANVSLGQLYMSYHFDIQMKHENKNVTGWAQGRTLFDQYWFTKRLRMIDGALEWDPFNLTRLEINSQFSIEYSEPKLTLDQVTIYIQLINDYLGTAKIKQNLIDRTNVLFAEKVQYHLNHEQLIRNSSIVYKYGNITLDYVHTIRDFQMTNNQTKGLEAFMFFGFQNGTQTCVDLPKEFDEDSYGGVQEVISMGIIKTTLQRAVNQGLFNQELNKQYEVPYFQFFMGDLGNFVDYANKLPAHDPFTISCEFAQDRASELKTVRFDEHDLYIQGPEDCSITYNSAVIMKVSFDMNLVVRFTAGENSLNAKIISVGVYGDKYYSVDPKFVVTDPYIARYTLTAVMKGLVGKTVFGTGWPTFARKYPVLRVLDDYIVIFDASES